MRIVLPVSRHDVHLLPQWVEVNNHLKTGAQHQLHIILPQSIAAAGFDAAAQLAGCFDSVQVHQMEVDPQGGWPVACNSQFYQCAQFMAQDSMDKPWFLCELDCLPVRSVAFDALASRFVSSGVPFMGSVEKAPWRDLESGKIVTSPEGPGDVMMSGCGVYPGNLLARPNFTALMADFMKGAESIDQAFDVHIRAAVRADGVSHTDLLGNHWNTVNYRIEGGRLVCDPRPAHEVFKEHPTWEQRKCAGIIHPDAVLVHGCKDESLAQLVLNDGIPDARVIATAPKESAPVAQAQGSTTTGEAIKYGRIIPDESMQRIANLEGQLATLIGLMSKQNEQKAEPATQTTLDDVSEVKPAPSAVTGKVITYFTEGGGKITALNLAKKLQLPYKEVTDAIEACPQLSAAGPAKWVQYTP